MNLVVASLALDVYCTSTLQMSFTAVNVAKVTLSYAQDRSLLTGDNCCILHTVWNDGRSPSAYHSIVLVYPVMKREITVIIHTVRL